MEDAPTDGKDAPTDLPTLTGVPDDMETHGRTVQEWASTDATRTQRWVRRITGWAWRVPLRSVAYGQEHIPQTGPFLMCPNHVSWLDGFVHVERQNRIVYIMGKSEVFSIPVLKWLLPHLGVFPVVRGGGDKAAREVARRILERGEPVLLYPEGTRKGHARALGTPHRGAALLALQTGAPVVPVGCAGLREWNDPRRVRIPCVTTVYGKPLHFGRAEPSEQNVAEARDAIWKSVAELRTQAVELNEQRRRSAGAGSG